MHLARGHTAKRLKTFALSSSAFALPAYSNDYTDASASEVYLSDLPDAVLGHIFQKASLPYAWPLRGVCRRWRSLIESTAWEEVELRSNCPPPGHFDQLASLVRAGQIKLASRACARLRVGMCHVNYLNYIVVASACGVLAACSKDGRLAEADVSFGIPEMYEGLAYENGGILHAFMIGTLSALRPQHPTRSSLEKLSISVAPDDKDFVDVDLGTSTPPSAENLQAALEPLGSIRSLKIMPNAFRVDSAAAAAIASSLPKLQSIYFQPADCGAMAALARLSSLSDVLIRWSDFGDEVAPWEISDALSALAEGPAGKSLQSLVLDDSSFWNQFPINSAALRSIARFPLLKKMALPLSHPDLLPADLAAFRSPSLRAVVARIERPGFTSERLRALEAALAGCPDLEWLDLDLCIPDAGAADAREALASLFRACAPSLCELSLELGRFLQAGEIQALAECTRLELLLMRCSVRSIAEIGPLQRLGSYPGMLAIRSTAIDIQVEGQEAGYEAIVGRLVQDAWPAAEVNAWFAAAPA
eukprot:tig00021221_g19352.t1